MSIGVLILSHITTESSHNGGVMSVTYGDCVLFRIKRRIVVFLPLNVHIVDLQDGLFITAVSNSFLSPLEKRSSLQIWDNLGYFSYLY